MEKIVERNLLYDFYGELLTDHQRAIYEDAVYGDLSLSELAEEYEITRQGIHDLLKRCDKILLSYEERLHLIDKFQKTKQFASEIKQIVNCDKDFSIEEYREGFKRIDLICNQIVDEL